MTHNFKVVLPLKKDTNSNRLIGTASTTGLDRDDERMSPEALKMMVDDIRRHGVNLFQDHQHGWEDTLGVVQGASIQGDQMIVDISLDDPSTNPKIPALINKLKKGIKLGLSVGGNVLASSWEYDRTAGKKIKVLDKVRAYEISIVGIPSNPDSYLSIPAAIAKSAKTGKTSFLAPEETITEMVKAGKVKYSF